MFEKLIEQLRRYGCGRPFGLYNRAADAIEELVDEVERLREALERMKRQEK